MAYNYGAGRDRLGGEKMTEADLMLDRAEAINGWTRAIVTGGGTVVLVFAFVAMCMGWGT